MKKSDLLLFGTVTVLTLFGLLMIYDASSVIAYNLFGDSYQFIKDQVIWVILGFIGMYITSRIDYHKYFNFALPFLIIALILLILVFIPGIGAGAKGAHRWIDLGLINFQPAEFVKLVLALYLSAWFSTKEKGRFLAFSILTGAVLFLIMLEPDMGTAGIILFEAIVVYFLSGGNIKYFLLGAPVIALVGFILIQLAPYRAARLTSFLSVDRSITDASYHIKQVLIALGNGGFFGLGIGNSLQKFAYLPENVTDSIFPIIAEEYGFVGASLLIILFMILVWRGFMIAIHARDNFGKLFAVGIVSFIGMQAILNLGSMTALLPLTGVPLPFISYGGSALLVDMASIGILLNISKQTSR